MGFVEQTLLHYCYFGNVEYFTFSDWRTEETGDIVTWVVVGGEIQEHLKDIDDS